jgi:hypothetical protein
MVSTSSLAGSRHYRSEFLPERPRLGRLLAILAVFDLSIWSYVAIAANPPVSPAAPPITTALDTARI